MIYLTNQTNPLMFGTKSDGSLVLSTVGKSLRFKTSIAVHTVQRNAVYVAGTMRFITRYIKYPAVKENANRNKRSVTYLHIFLHNVDRRNPAPR